MKRRFGRRYRFNALAGAILVGLTLLTALVGMVYTPYDPLAIDLDGRLQLPCWQHWMGTDQFGRDIFSRLLAAAVVSVSVSLSATLLAISGGTLIGALIGYLGGGWDRLGMMVLDALMALPAILLAMGIMVAVGPSKTGMILALGLAFTPSVARVVRGAVLSIKQREYIEASRALGNTHLFTIARHVVPNCITPLTVIGTALFAFALLAESALSFLGLGVPPPYPTWGGMLSDARQYVALAPWLGIFPGLAISLALLGINLSGDALRDRLDPRVQV